MKWEHYAVKEGKTLRYGYTTGTCAAAAASVAAEMSLSRKPVNLVRIKTPKGIVLELEPEEATFLLHGARAAVRKDAGDDPDITDGLLIFVTAELTADTGIILCGGEGVGTVTKPGLSSLSAVRPSIRRRDV